RAAATSPGAHASERGDSVEESGARTLPVVSGADLSAAVPSDRRASRHWLALPQIFCRVPAGTTDARHRRAKPRRAEVHGTIETLRRRSSPWRYERRESRI